MSSENIKLLKSLKEGLLEDKERASRLLDKYGEIAYGPNVDYNSEEAQDADVIHDALLHHIEIIDEQLDSVDRQIAREEKHIAKDKTNIC